MNDHVEAVLGEFLSETATYTVAGACYKCPMGVTVEVPLQGGGSCVETNESKKLEDEV